MTYRVIDPGTPDADCAAPKEHPMNRRHIISSLALSTMASATSGGRARRVAALPCGRVAFVDQGAGPAALFIHGFPLSSFQWRHTVERLSPFRRCLAPDLLGLGETWVAPGQAMTPTDQARMLAALLDYLGVQEVDLVANDSGNAIAQLFAVDNPGRVRTLLLTNGDSEPDCPPAPLRPVLQLATEGRLADEVFVRWANDPASARAPSGFGGLCYQHPEFLTNENVRIYLQPLVATPERKALLNAYAAGLASNVLAGLAAHLARLHVPTRIVWGMADGIFDSRMAHYLDRLFPQSRGVRRVAQGKLFWPEEYPNILEAELLRLWQVPLWRV
jgi:pimeloyl-ACP methyl ester carboxylesterase